MGWVIFWLIVVAYWVVGIKRLPMYFRRCADNNQADYPNSYTDERYANNNAWEAIALALFWPYYEFGRWVRDTVIQTATAEQRKQEAYEQARKIVEDYEKNKEKRDKEEFDRKLRELPDL